MTETTAPAETTYSVRLTPAEYVATVDKIAKVNDRAVKRGFTGRLEVLGERVEKTTTDSLGFQVTEVFYETSITGQAPSYGGWTFLARCDRLEDTFTIAAAPGAGHVDRSLVRPGECDHCGHARQRNNTYLVRNDETGQVVNVGSTCIKDFLGWSASVVFFSDSDVQIERDSLGYAPRSYSVDTVLAYAYAAIRAFGWVPASSYDARPTRALVTLALYPPSRMTEQEQADVRALTAFAAEAQAKVEEIKAYILSDDFAGDSTYVDNLKVSVGVDYVTSRQVGLLVSAPQALIRHQEGEAKRAARAARPVSEFLGEEGGKIVISGTIEAIRYIEGNYGTTVLYTLLTDEGNAIKWFASREALGEETGVKVTLSGTVKKHEDHETYGKSTVLTRCKAV